MTADSLSQPAPRRVLAGVLNVALFSAALLGAGAVATRGVSVPADSMLARKLAHLEKDGGAYSAVFIGSSRVAHHFVPAQFDAALAARGHAVKSFNLGQDGMFAPELFYALRKMFAAGVRPRWVLVDVTRFSPVFQGEGDPERTVLWHDWRHTWMACRHEPANALYHLRLWGQRTVGQGLLQEQLTEELKLKKPQRFRTPPDAGFEALEPRPLSTEESEQFARYVGKMKADTEFAPMPPVFREGLLEAAALIRVHGAEPVFVVAPDVTTNQRFTDWPPTGVVQFAYDSPEKFPSLYAVGQRWDRTHLDHEGAKEFTRIFAADFASMLEGKRK